MQPPVLQIDPEVKKAELFLSSSLNGVVRERNKKDPKPAATAPSPEKHFVQDSSGVFRECNKKAPKPALLERLNAHDPSTRGATLADNDASELQDVTHHFDGTSDSSTTPVPLEMRETEPSAGSAQHPHKCKPCAWYWKPEGCESGKNCVFCHMCPDGELKNRKKTRQTELRHQQQAQQQRKNTAAVQCQFQELKIAPLITPPAEVDMAHNQPSVGDEVRIVSSKDMDNYTKNLLGKVGEIIEKRMGPKDTFRSYYRVGFEKKSFYKTSLREPLESAYKYCAVFHRENIEPVKNDEIALESPATSQSSIPAQRPAQVAATSQLEIQCAEAHASGKGKAWMPSLRPASGPGSVYVDLANVHLPSKESHALDSRTGASEESSLKVGDSVQVKRIASRNVYVEQFDGLVGTIVNIHPYARKGTRPYKVRFAKQMQGWFDERLFHADELERVNTLVVPPEAPAGEPNATAAKYHPGQLVYSVSPIRAQSEVEGPITEIAPGTEGKIHEADKEGSLGIEFSSSRFVWITKNKFNKICCAAAEEDVQSEDSQD